MAEIRSSADCRLRVFEPRGNRAPRARKMEIGMLLPECTFEGLDLDRENIASDATPSCAPKRPADVSAAATIGPQIEAEIAFLQRVVRRWYREAADADDLVQDTLLRALASAHLWQPGSNLRAWLVTIMRNQFLETVGRARRWDAAAEIIDTADHRVSAHLEARLTLRDVERAFRRLPAKQRSALLLAGIEGKPYIEVARMMGLSVDAVRCHLARARQRLRTAVYQRDDNSRGSTPMTCSSHGAGSILAARTSEMV